MKNMDLMNALYNMSHRNSGGLKIELNRVFFSSRINIIELKNGYYRTDEEVSSKPLLKI